MTRRRILRTTAVAVALSSLAVAFAVWVLGMGPDVDRDQYVARNVALLDTVPLFPGARLAEATSSSPHRPNDLAGARIDGYETSRGYRLPAGTRPETVIRFYRRALAPDWKRLTGMGLPKQHLAMTRGDAYLDILAANGHVDVMVDHDGW